MLGGSYDNGDEIMGDGEGKMNCLLDGKRRAVTKGCAG
jgi:hypothetical protein